MYFWMYPQNRQKANVFVIGCYLLLDIIYIFDKIDIKDQEKTIQ